MVIFLCQNASMCHLFSKITPKVLLGLLCSFANAKGSFEVLERVEICSKGAKYKINPIRLEHCVTLSCDVVYNTAMSPYIIVFSWMLTPRYTRACAGLFWCLARCENRVIEQYFFFLPKSYQMWGTQPLLKLT